MDTVVQGSYADRSWAPLIGHAHPERRRRPAGRVCGEDGCVTILSTYNTTPFCSLHEAFWDPRARRRRID
jgi:hypothetical protein